MALASMWDRDRRSSPQRSDFVLLILYPFALIAAGIESLVSGFASQAWKKMAAFLAWSSTLYSLLFENIVELFR